jgi:hypothetical protein
MIIDGHEAVPRHAFFPVFGLAAFHARSQTELIARLPSRLLPNTFGVTSSLAGHFLILPSAFLLSVFVLLEIKRSAAMMAGRVPRAPLFFLFTFAFFLSATAR